MNTQSNKILTVLSIVAGISLSSCGGGDNNRNLSPIINNNGGVGGGGACITAINGVVQTYGVVGVSFNGQATAQGNELLIQSALPAGPGGQITPTSNQPNVYVDQNFQGDRLQLNIQSQGQQPIGGGGYGSYPVTVNVNGQIQLSGMVVNYIASFLQNPYQNQQPFGGIQGQQFQQVACVTSVSTSGGGYYGPSPLYIATSIGGGGSIQGELFLTIGGQGGQSAVGYVPPIGLLF